MYASTHMYVCRTGVLVKSSSVLDLDTINHCHCLRVKEPFLDMYRARLWIRYYALLPRGMMERSLTVIAAKMI